MTWSISHSRQEATIVSEALVRHQIPRFEVPLFIHSDQRTNFTSAVLKGLCSILRMERSIQHLYINNRMAWLRSLLTAYWTCNNRTLSLIPLHQRFLSGFFIDQVDNCGNTPPSTTSNSRTPKPLRRKATHKLIYNIREFLFLDSYIGLIACFNDLEWKYSWNSHIFFVREWCNKTSIWSIIVSWLL